jgi:hypothetical protein
MLTQTDLQKIDGIVGNRIDSAIGKLIDSEIAPIKRDIRKIRKDLSTVTRFFDNEILSTQWRVDRIEEHLDLPPIS